MTCFKYSIKISTHPCTFLRFLAVALIDVIVAVAVKDNSRNSKNMTLKYFFFTKETKVSIEKTIPIKKLSRLNINDRRIVVGSTVDKMDPI